MEANSYPQRMPSLLFRFSYLMSLVTYSGVENSIHVRFWQIFNTSKSHRIRKESDTLKKETFFFRLKKPLTTMGTTDDFGKWKIRVKSVKHTSNRKSHKSRQVSHLWEKTVSHNNLLVRWPRLKSWNMKMTSTNLDVEMTVIEAFYKRIQDLTNACLLT